MVCDKHAAAQLFRIPGNPDNEEGPRKLSQFN